ncbi:MAG: DUF512 domain-containing protein [candidate division KSB1 bacterium]|nr:DUF512 domain-containing protein [candidate division KSB1 bacterium]MDZ7318202.1 DUF512 domain-containing protein [candidate division KSB1 bacterium]MDZ7341597.1 DUF512 domain-containing protein [candidate division KSB1 bacterium]
MKIIAFEKSSTAAAAGLQVGDDIIKINGAQIRDAIDFQFHVSDELLTIEVIRANELLVFEIDKDFDDSLGIIFEETKFRCCGNHCIFCFVDQNPSGLRESLYFKDEDFRLSFLYGNYVTLTNVGRSDLQRIVTQRLSPLYISVHSTNLEIRKLLLGLTKDDRLLQKIEFLAKHGIEMHAQIVLCPQINDGDPLTKTILDLARYYPNLKSIAIVPVGLTRHRNQLYPLQPVTAAIAKTVIEQVETLARQFKQQHDEHLVYLADEFYLLAGCEVPPADRYEGFPQLENGVGMVRDFIDRWQEQIPLLPHRIRHAKKLTLVSGVLAAPVLEQWLLPRLNRIENLTARIAAVTNHFYGSGVTVSGLLTGQDIFEQLRHDAASDWLFLPANCLNYEGKFLDDWTPEQLSEQLKTPIEIVGNDFIAAVEKLS